MVKKRNPLVLPPNFEKIPVPDSINEKIEKEDEKIKKILKAPQTDNFPANKESSIEDSILKEFVSEKLKLITT